MRDGMQWPCARGSKLQVSACTGGLGAVGGVGAVTGRGTTFLHVQHVHTGPPPAYNAGGGYFRVRPG